MRECLFRFWMVRCPRRLVATALMLFACSSASLKALVSPDGNFNYTIATDKVTITGYTGTGGNVVIPFVWEEGRRKVGGGVSGWSELG